VTSVRDIPAPETRRSAHSFEENILFCPKIETLRSRNVARARHSTAS